MENNDRRSRDQRLEDKAFDEMRREGREREEGRIRKEEGRRNSSSLWIWLGVIVLIFIIIYWLFAIGTFGDLANWFNG
mgnify:CR=1 FL=1